MGDIEGSYRVLQTPGTRLGAQFNAGISTLEPGQSLSANMVSGSRNHGRGLQVRVQVLDDSQEFFDVDVSLSPCSRCDKLAVCGPAGYLLPGVWPCWRQLPDGCAAEIPPSLRLLIQATWCNSPELWFLFRTQVGAGSGSVLSQRLVFECVDIQRLAVRAPCMAAAVPCCVFICVPLCCKITAVKQNLKLS